MGEQLDKHVSPRPKSRPMIYAYSDDNPAYAGLLKVGYTARSVEERVAQQYPTKRPGGKVPYRIEFAESAMFEDGGSFDDHDIHRMLKEKGIACEVGEFIGFLPVIAYDGSTMRQIDAGEILDIAMSGTSATLLARRWESALLVNVDNETLGRLMASDEAMAALKRIEGFRSLNSDIETIINKSESVKRAKKDREKLSAKEKKKLSEEEKEYKSKLREIQEKLIKFATRIPIFMYLTDYREHCLKEVVTQLEPKLFKKVTGLEVRDFNLLCKLNIFNVPLMNDAVYKFKRYEDASLVYTGLESRHAGESVGLFDTVLSPEDYATLYHAQQQSMG